MNKKETSKPKRVEAKIMKLKKMNTSETSKKKR